jgi:choline dehydrogenase
MNSSSATSFNDADSFDFVIVGSGAAGAILAERLSADGASVCVLEAGPPDHSPYLHIPAGFIKAVFNNKYAWQFSSEPTALTNGRRIPIPQGRTLGGSTSINGLVYNRGQAADFDHWAGLGNPGWSFADVLPYFKSMERRVGGDDAYRGRQGKLPVSDIDWIHPLCEAFIAGAQEFSARSTTAGA